MLKIKQLDSVGGLQKNVVIINWKINFHIEPLHEVALIRFPSCMGLLYMVMSSLKKEKNYQDGKYLLSDCLQISGCFNLPFHR